jgi:flagellar basal-body rod protein FlgG
MRALSTAASGMLAYQTKIDNIANNLANSNTTGFKKVRENFEDLVYQNVAPRGSSSGAAPANPIQIGSGVRLAGLTRDTRNGAAVATGNPYNLMITNDGYFLVETAAGEELYTRDGNFTVDNEGNLVTQSGHRLAPGIQIPAGTVEFRVGEDGTATASVVNSTGATEEQNLGQIELARFTHPGGLTATGGNFFRATEASGDPIKGTPGEDGMGKISQGVLEGSNVDVAEELVAMITAQRSYELSSKVIQAADEMMSTAVNLRR